jgi:hypothetical protein
VALSAGWKVSAFELTAQRAQRMVAAINAYREAQGSYPAELGELSPRYILYVPPPVAVRQGGWCYQGSPEGYRLGFVIGDFTYFEAKFREDIYSQQGELQENDSWRCDAMVRLFEQGNTG